MLKDLSEFSSAKDFTTLEAWKKLRVLKMYFYKEVTPLLPAQEQFNLHSQIRRACISGTANTAEGYGRYHYQEGIQFYRISRASVYELKDHLISCYDLDYIDRRTFEKGYSLIEEAKAVLNGYIKFVGAQKKKEELKIKK